MTTLIRNYCRRVARNTFVLMLFCVAFALGGSRQTKFMRTKGNMSLPFTCSQDAASMDILAVKYDTAHTCHNLGWEWGHEYDDISTYYEKQRVAEKFKRPMVLGEAIRLPIIFDDGAYIDMYIEFTTIDFSFGRIQLKDTLDETFNVYDSEPEVVMIHLAMINGEKLVYKTWNGGWINLETISTFPFTTGIVYKITFKALGNAFEVLVDDEQHVTYSFDVHSSEARLLQFSDVGMLLHKIEFVA